VSGLDDTACHQALIREAEQLGANAIVGLRFELTAGQNTSELIGYGTGLVFLNGFGGDGGSVSD
jgi:uncharacterized protein YbjQ (UPF0145 family)